MSPRLLILDEAVSALLHFSGVRRPGHESVESLAALLDDGLLSTWLAALAALALVTLDLAIRSHLLPCQRLPTGTEGDVLRECSPARFPPCPERSAWQGRALVRSRASALDASSLTWHHLQVRRDTPSDAKFAPPLQGAMRSAALFTRDLQ